MLHGINSAPPLLLYHKAAVPAALHFREIWRAAFLQRRYQSQASTYYLVLTLRCYNEDGKSRVATILPRYLRFHYM